MKTAEAILVHKRPEYQFIFVPTLAQIQLCAAKTTKNLKDIIINRSRISKPIFFAIFIFLGGMCAYSIWKWDNKDVLISGTLLTGWYFIYKRQPKRAQILIKINEERLWTRNRGNKNWNSVICIRFRYEQHRNYMDVYVSNDVVADEEIDLHEVDMPVWWLKRILKRHVKVENH